MCVVHEGLSANQGHNIVCIPVHVGLLNMPCYASLGTILSTLCVHHIYSAGSSLTTTSGVAPARPKMLSSTSQPTRPQAYAFSFLPLASLVQNARDISGYL